MRASVRGMIVGSAEKWNITGGVLTASEPLVDSASLFGAQMDVTEDQMPPTPDRPPSPEKGIPPRQEPDTGPRPDFNNPEPDEEGEPVDPLPDMDPDGQDPESEVLN
jgi:hypothetical protein